MNETVKKCTKELIEAIRNSEEYHQFEESKAKLAQHPELGWQAQEFRKRVFLMQNSDASIDLLDEMEHLFQTRETLYKIPVLADYLNSELKMCRMLQKINMDLLNVTDIEIESFENIISI